MTRRQPSLKRPLILQPLLFQLFTLVVSFTLLLAYMVRMDSGGPYADQTVAEAAVRAIVRDAHGNLSVHMTPELRKIRKESPDLWFVAKDRDGRQVSYGAVPAEYHSLIVALPRIAWADIRDGVAPHDLSTVIRHHAGPAGELAIIAHGKLNTVTMVVALAANIAVIPVFLLLVLGAVIITPWIVRRSLAGVSRIAREAEQINVERRGIRLTEAEVPTEIGPLVRAVNEALARLDEGYERQRRFIASAAHELRTPIAIVQVKLEDADDATAHKVMADVARLSTLAEQLLDLHRLDSDEPMERIDLAGLVRRVVADLAPLLIASNKAIEVLVDNPLFVSGSVGALERVVTNLVQNAVEHGGERVTVRVYDTMFDVEDDGPGIPVDERERVFEPFHRIKPRQTGTGLGLNLVQQVVERHRGRVTILDAPSGGAIIRVALPPLS